MRVKVYHTIYHETRETKVSHGHSAVECGLPVGVKFILLTLFLVETARGIVYT